jgi:hypothetical protein
VTATVAKSKANGREVKEPKEAISKDTVVGTRTGSEAACWR